MTKDTFYFSHDFSSRNDPKLQELQMVHGMEGVGVFWCLVEMLHEQDGYLMLSQCKSYAFALRVDCELIKAVVLGFSLFKNDGTQFWSESALERIQERKAKSIKAKESADKRWKNANAMRTQCDGNAIKESKGKEIKEKKNNSIESFASFWDLYAKKNDKVKCEKAWSKLTEQERVHAIESLPDYIKRTPDVQYRKNPLTWLNGKCWNDEGPKVNGTVKCPLGNVIDFATYPEWPMDKPFTPSNIVRFNQKWPLRADNS